MTGCSDCPICHKYFPPADLERHAAFCKGETLERTRVLKSLAKPVYHLLRDAQIRGKLAELGLKTSGDRGTLIKRHSEYVLLHNAECDAGTPRSVTSLRRELERSEKQWGRATK